MSDQASRRQMAAFLRSCRGRLSPVEAGLHPGVRRRTPGLRREEVALLSDVSVTWYTWLEQAREITVSRSVLTSIADALQLTRAERRHLFGLAGHQPPADNHVEPPSPTLQALVDGLHPNPAYLLNSRSDMLAWNRAEAALIGDPGELPEAERNILWQLFISPENRHMVIDWRRQALGLLALYRVEAALHSGDPQFAALTAALRDASPEFRHWWDNNIVADFQTPRWEFDHPRWGRLAFDYVKFTSTATPDIKLVAALPADPQTSHRLTFW